MRFLRNQDTAENSSMESSVEMHLSRGDLQQLLLELKEAPRAAPPPQPRPPVSKRSVSQPMCVDRNPSSDTVRYGGHVEEKLSASRIWYFFPFYVFVKITLEVPRKAVQRSQSSSPSSASWDVRP